MKKIIIIFFIILIILGLLIGIKNSLKKSNFLIDFDYSNLKENEVFYQDFDELLGDSKYTNCINIKEEFNSSNKILIRVLDNNFIPIPEAEITLYDENGYALADLKMNQNGELAIQGLENDVTYYLEQEKTKKDYVIDPTVYEVNIDSENKTFELTIFNAENEITAEKKEELKKIYLDKKENTNTEEEKKEAVVITSEEAIMNQESMLNDSYSYSFFKDGLRGKKLFIYTYGTSINNYNLQQCSIYLEDCEILMAHVEDLYDDEDLVQITDKDGNLKKDFENNESFYVKYNFENYDDNIQYQLTLIFRYKGKVYKIKKEISVGITKSGKNGYIDASFKDGEGNPLPGARAILKKVYPKSGKEEIFVVGVEVGDSGKLFFSRLKAGTYKLIKNYNDENLSEKIIEVKSGETTEVEL